MSKIKQIQYYNDYSKGWNDAQEVYIRSIAAYKGQLTCQRKKSAEAVELVQLLEWAKKKELLISGYGDGTFEIEELVENQVTSVVNTIARESSLLLALREAKKIVEKENGK
jgi:hypothetical protein